MAIDHSTYSRFLNLQESIGKSALHFLFPNDFEVYICSLELVDSDDLTVDVLVFPVMPEQMEERKPTNTNIKKTAAGVVAFSTPSFVPTDISLRGNFGKNFKFLLGRTIIDTSVVSYSTLGGNYLNTFGELNILNKTFTPFIKTGYGAFKILESIVFKSRMLDRKNNPFRLYFYNPALGNSYMVKAVDFTGKQSKETNMIWNYALNLKSIAPITVRSASANKRSLLFAMASDAINKSANMLMNNMKFVIRNPRTYNPANLVK